jgi:hypothetical protein
MGGHVNLVEEVIGTEAFRLLRDWAGGGDFYVPLNLQSQIEALEGKIGEEPARRLMAWAGGSRIYIISSEEYEIEKRKDELRAMRNRGMTLEEISRNFRFESRYSIRQISRLLTE